MLTRCPHCKKKIYTSVLVTFRDDDGQMFLFCPACGDTIQAEELEDLKVPKC